MELQDAVGQLLAACHVVSSSPEGLQSLVDRRIEEPTAQRLLASCQLLRPVSQVTDDGRRLLFLDAGAQPVLNFLIISGSLLILVLLWELWLQSTLVCSSSMRDRSKLAERIKALGGRLAEYLQGKPQGSEGRASRSEASDSEEDEVSHANLWHELSARAKGLLAAPQAQSPAAKPSAEVGFARLHFNSLVSEGEAVVELVRRGASDEELEVSLRPCERLEEADGVADNGKDYSLLGSEAVRFAPGEVKAELRIPLYRPRQHRATKYFEIELYKVLKGSAVIAGPTVGLEDVTARVYISYDYAFPHNIPVEKQQSRFWITCYYLLERKANRGWRWWKTLLGLLYAPVHAVCVTAFIQKIVLDQITDSSIPGNKDMELLAVGLAQFASTALLRWGDKVATENRGRTGGTRMVHRRQLFAKLLMLDAEELAKIQGKWWFYVGVNNVDLMAKDAYYQGFVLLQSLFGLVLSIVMMIYVQWSKYEEAGREYDFMPVVEPGLFQLLMVLLCCGLLFRTKRLGELLMHRMAGEAAWVDSLSWLCHAGLPLKSLASRVRSNVDLRFVNEVKYFVSYHVSARDWSNDTLWCVHWLTNIAYILVLLLGAKMLLKEHEEGSTRFQAGDFVFQLKVFTSCGKYLSKTVSSLIKMYSASVGLQQFSEIMNWPERSTVGLTRILHDAGGQEIIFERESSTSGRQLELLNPARAVRQDLTIPLGCVIRVTSQRERHLLNFLHQVSELKAPHYGRLRRPQGIRIAYVPAIALHAPHATVLEELVLEGQEVALQLIAMFQLDPNKKIELLEVGQRQTMALILAMFRNPEVLVLDRPLAFMTPLQRRKILVLLCLWQKGGVDAILCCLRSSEPLAKGRERTLIVSEAEDELPPMLFKEIRYLDLDGQGHIDFFRLLSL